ncbi:hypothetical protein KL86PLE_90704 [uncultured Pleomorphomonas sp.]|uniref:Uncharacterized protein n=1 Tax=uncultured Pleomorphomonas sp. TaxID=442121 RepID=A0A212LQX2_9HYPH|nr:hypothetical protein [uncultured Pleomorphomonas sp.]SCM79912.1 hypothetical protein KL86PLE_90704 [uncultured Pleomorphomonas sp.]
MTRKRITLAVTVTIPEWMTKRLAGREVRTLINEQCNWLSGGPYGEQVDETTVRAVAVKPMKKEGR